ncbi:MAG: YncE family protein [bacterium]
MIILTLVMFFLVWGNILTKNSIKELQTGNYLKQYVTEEKLLQYEPYDIALQYSDGKKESARIINATIDSSNLIGGLEFETKSGKTLILNTYHSVVTLSESNVQSITLTELADYEPANRSLAGIKLQLKTITSVELADGSIVTSKLADATITGGKIQTGVIETSHLNNGIVTSIKFADGTLTTTKILNGTIQGEDLADQTITTDKLADNAVTADKIENGTINNPDLADESINDAKVVTGANIDWSKISKIGSSIADLTNRNSTDLALADLGNFFTTSNIEGALAELAVAEASITNDHLRVDASNGPVSGTLILKNLNDAPELVIKDKVGQTANLQEWQDNNGNILNVIDYNGNLGVGTSTTANYNVFVAGSGKVTGRFSAPEMDRWLQVPDLNRNITTKPLTINTGGIPRGLAFDGSYLWTANDVINTISKIDVNTGQIVATLSDPAMSGPHTALFDGTYIWMLCWNSTLVKVDINKNIILGVYNYNNFAGTALAYDGRYIWASASNNNIYKIDPETVAIVATVNNPGHGWGYATFDGKYLWSIDGIGTVTKLDIDTNTIAGYFYVGNGLLGIAYDGTNIWVANGSTYTYSKIDSKSGAVLADIPANASWPLGMTFDGTYVWVANFGGNISAIDPNTNTVVQTIGSFGNPHQILFDGQAIWVSNSNAGAVSKYNVATSTSTSLTNRNEFYVGQQKTTAVLGVANSENFNDVITNYNGSLESVSAEASTSGGTAFDLLQNINSYLYVMRKTPFQSVYFNLQTKAVGLTLAVEYWNGSTWINQTFSDNTTDLSNNGTLVLSSVPSNWLYSTVNGTTGYFLRIRTVTNPSTISAAYAVLPSDRDALYVNAQLYDPYPAFFVSKDSLIGIGTANPKAQFEVNAVVDLTQTLIKANATQTANLTEWQDNSAAVLASINKDGGIVLNENGVGTNIRFEGDNNQNSFIIAGVSDKIGIGTNVAKATLDVDGFIRLKNNNAAPAICTASNESSIAITSGYAICICNGSAWVQLKDGIACTW